MTANDGMEYIDFKPRWMRGDDPDPVLDDCPSLGLPIPDDPDEIREKIRQFEEARSRCEELVEVVPILQDQIDMLYDDLERLSKEKQ